MRQLIRQLRPAAAVVAAILVALALAVPALAKEGMEAKLDAPIAMGTPGGTEILVGVTVTVFGESGALDPVEGTPVYLKLFGRDGTWTRAAGAADRTPGHYTMRIAIPAGGARNIEIGIHGTSDLPIMLQEDAFAFGDITARTAQLAPPLAAALTPLPRVSAPAVAVAPAAAPVVAPVAAPPPAVPAVVGLGVLLAAGLLVAAALLAVRRRRTRDAASSAATSTPEPHRASGA